MLIRCEENSIGKFISVALVVPEIRVKKTFRCLVRQTHKVFDLSYSPLYHTLSAVWIFYCFTKGVEKLSGGYELGSTCGFVLHPKHFKQYQTLPAVFKHININRMLACIS